MKKLLLSLGLQRMQSRVTVVRTNFIITFTVDVPESVPWSFDFEIKIYKIIFHENT